MCSLSSILSRLTMNKHVGRHYELVYSHTRARVDTGTLERDMQIQTKTVSEVQDKINVTHCSIITR